MRKSVETDTTRHMELSPRSPRLYTPRPPSARPEDLVGRFMENQYKFGYETRNLMTRGQASNAHQWWDFYVMKTNVRRLNAQPTSPRMLRPISPRDATSPRGYSPRAALSTASTLGPDGRRKKLAYYPQYTVPLDKPFKPPTPLVESAPAPAEAKVEVVAVKKREWGELPAGVVPQDLQKAQMAIKDKLTDKFGSLAKAFRSIDTDGSGVCSIEEFEKMLETFNLTGIRKDVVQVMFELIDVDQTGDFSYKEFLRVINASNIMEMAKIPEKLNPYEVQKKEREAAELAAKMEEAKRMDMTLEEYEEYWASIPKSAFGQMTSEEMAQVIR
jgi:hypothetical protein